MVGVPAPKLSYPEVLALQMIAEGRLSEVTWDAITALARLGLIDKRAEGLTRAGREWLKRYRGPQRPSFRIA
jgi:hypothetical protein